MAKRGGRVARGERFWRAALVRRRRSGLTVAEFCQREGLTPSSYYYWRREVERRDGGQRQAASRSRPSSAKGKSIAAESTSATPTFSEVVLGGSVSREPARCLEIELPSGYRLRVPSGYDRSSLADVLSLLENRPC